MTDNPYRQLIDRVNKKKPKTESARHARRALLNKRQFSLSLTILIVTIIFLFLPLFFIGLYSFNAEQGAGFSGFSLMWYRELLFNSEDLWDALGNSLLVALSSALVSTILGTMAAVGIHWYEFKGRAYIQSISFLPMVLPEVIIGVSMVIFFAGIGVPLGLFTIFAAHTTFCLPFVFLMVTARIDDFDFSIVEASRDLGATERQTMTKVIVPGIMPGILSGFMMAITMSLEDFVITFFVSGPGSTTLPLYVYSMIRFGVSPVINSLSVLLVLVTLLIAIGLRPFLKTIAAAR